jgi:hypothetical protein
MFNRVSIDDGTDHFESKNGKKYLNGKEIIEHTVNVPGRIRSLVALGFFTGILVGFFIGTFFFL